MKLPFIYILWSVSFKCKEYWTHMLSGQNHMICISHSYQNSGNTTQNLIQLLLFRFLTHAYSTNVPYHRLTDEWGRIQRKGTTVPYCVFIFQAKVMSKKEQDRVPWSFVFLRMLPSSLCLKQVFIPQGKGVLLGLLTSLPLPSLPSHRQNTLILVSLEFPWTPTCHGHARILCSWQMLHANGTTGMDRHKNCTCVLCSCTCAVGPSQFTYQIQVQTENCKNF